MPTLPIRGPRLATYSPDAVRTVLAQGPDSIQGDRLA
ncbi:MAG: hypothetical protein QOE89_1104, partial [Pseudonocardiales bacterium]|nr:hypothetical protein [Pseudonocardiales bacterium]